MILDNINYLGNGYSWSRMKTNFLSSWFSENNMRKAGLLITALQNKPKVIVKYKF